MQEKNFGLKIESVLFPDLTLKMNESLSSSAENIQSNSSQIRISPILDNNVVETAVIINSEPRPSTSRSIEEQSNGQNISNSSENDLNQSNKRTRIDKGKY